MWLIFTILALTAFAALHFGWRRRFFRAKQDSEAQIQSLRDQLDQHVRQSRAAQETVFNSMVEGLLWLDNSGRVQLANRAFGALFGVKGDLRGKTVLELVRQHELTDLLDRVGKGREVLGCELQLSGPAECCVRVNAAPVLDAQGAMQGSILVFHDLTRLKELERTREEFVANVSHELRTPLSLIKGYVETLLDGAKDNPELATRFLQTIQRNSERLQFLIEDLLTIAKLESGRLQMNLQPVPLRPLIDKVLEDFKDQAAARQVRLTNEMPDLIAPADAERLQHVIGNLVGNAIAYGRSEGRVVVSGRLTDGAVELCVQDDGPGIPAEALERVFERFYRVDKARSREHGGTGLGLSIVKHIIQSHGGQVWARSEPGKGAAFYFTLPITGVEA